MAKRNRRQGRGASRHRYYAPSPGRVMPLAQPLRLSPLSLYEDRRTWHPDDARIVQAVRSVFAFRRSAKRIIDRANPMWHARSALSFADPSRVIVCLRRKIRREVIHAFKKNGKGGRGQKRPKRNFYSAIGC